MAMAIHELMAADDPGPLRDGDGSTGGSNGHRQPQALARWRPWQTTKGAVRRESGEAHVATAADRLGPWHKGDVGAAATRANGRSWTGKQWRSGWGRLMACCIPDGASFIVLFCCQSFSTVLVS